VSFQIFVFPKSLWPYSLFPWREDAIRIDGVFDRLDKAPVRVVVEVVQRRDTVYTLLAHRVQMTRKGVLCLPIVFT
jgi:hypothetical protein